MEINTILCADNLDVMKTMTSSSIDIIATDPPYATERSFIEYDDRWSTPRVQEHISLRAISPDTANYTDWVEEYIDIKLSNYLVFMGVRIIEMRRLLKETGSIYIQCNQKANSYIRILLDIIFGKQNFRNEIIWCYSSPSRSTRQFPHKHDTILFYSKTNDWYFNAKDIRVSYKRKFSNKNSGIFKGYMTEEKINSYMENGKVPLSWWDDCTIVGKISKEITGYPTQKPIKLYERIIKSSCPYNGIVMDPFMGSGTTLIAAINSGMRYIGIDNNQKAFDLTKSRISNNE